MKKISIVLVTVLFIFGCSTMSKLEYSGNYAVVQEDRKSIQGDYSIESFLLYKKSFFDLHIVSIEKIKKTSMNPYYFISIRYRGDGWEFINGIKIKTDSTLFTLVDDGPSRETLGGSKVAEHASIVLSQNNIDAIKSTNSLILQYESKYKNDPITIPVEGIVKLKAFIE